MKKGKGWSGSGPIRTVCSTSGESLVEVMAGAVLFLTMVAIMQGAIRFCTNVQHRSGQIRERNAQVCRHLQDAAYPYTGGATGTYGFRATDGGAGGSGILFRVTVQLGKKEIPYEDVAGNEQSMSFSLFGPAPTGGGGG